MTCHFSEPRELSSKPERLESEKIILTGVCAHRLFEMLRLVDPLVPVPSRPQGSDYGVDV